MEKTNSSSLTKMFFNKWVEFVKIQQQEASDYNDERTDYYENLKCDDEYDNDNENGNLYGDFDDWEDYIDSIYN